MSDSKRVLDLILEEIKAVRTKADKSDERLDSIDKTLVKQEEQLANHIRRTELLEKRAELIESEIQPIKNHVTQVNGAMKLFGVISGVVFFAVAVIEIIRFFK